MGVPVKLKDDIFILNADSKLLLYSPLRGAAFYSDNSSIKFFEDYITTESKQNLSKRDVKIINRLEGINAFEPVENKNIDTTYRVTILLTQKCNMGCTYCYAQFARSSDRLDRKKLSIVIKHILKDKKKKNKYFSFLGGGEPTLEWDLFTYAVNYIFANAGSDLSIKINLTTNATLLTPERIEWLKCNKVSVNVSFDILPQIQNKQRPLRGLKESFNIVDKTIKELDDKGVKYFIRSTITENFIYLMPLMVDFVSKNYKSVKKLHLEPVTDVDNKISFYKEFPEFFFQARKLGLQKGINVYNSITNSFDHLRFTFCNGEFCVTPNGDIVSCHRISSDTEELYKYFYYGFIDNAVNTNEVLEANNMEINSNKIIECAHCFAKWHCAGGCTVGKLIFNQNQQVAYCEYVRKMLLLTIMEKMDDISSINPNYNKYDKH